MRWIVALVLGMSWFGCAAPSANEAAKPPIAGLVRPGTPPEVDVARARAAGAKQLFEWLPYEAASFERARREGKLILLDGAASWCHWCHVMDETTYKDAEVGALLRDRFVTIRVDIDQHPDVAERYADYGWPATIILSPESEERGKLRGYVPRDELLAALRDVSRGAGAKVVEDANANRAATKEELPWVVANVVFQLDDYYDDRLGGWGQRQKAPLGENLEFEARRAQRGDARATSRVLATIEGQRGLLDPVWGGLYQYSDGGSWTAPHFEKLMTYQAANLSAYASAFSATKDRAVRADAQAILGYMTAHLSDERGLFFVSQDADVGSHGEGERFVDGHVFYAKPDAERRALGAPRVDESTYPFENGIAIHALLAFHEATGDTDALARAKRAADHFRAELETSGHVARRGEGVRDVRFLIDAASIGLAFTKLARLTKDAAYERAATQTLEAIERDFASEGAYFGVTVDPHAAGVFAARRRPWDANVMLIRFWASLASHRGDDALKARAVSLLGAVSTPAAIAKQGRMLGSYLLAADELGLVR